MFILKRATGLAAVDISIPFDTTYRLTEVRLTLSAAAADLDEFAVGLDSAQGAAFDTVLAAPDPAEDLSTVTSWRFADPSPPVIFSGDSLTITWPNAGGVTWAIEVIGE